MNNGEVLLTGGAGFIGTNVARNYLLEGARVHIFDNLVRADVERNVSELRGEFPGQVRFSHADVRDRKALAMAVNGAARIYHLAAQVAVTTSMDDPLRDFETNLAGTLYLLEAVRKSADRPPILFTSTNKVYGHLAGVALRERGSRYEPRDSRLAEYGIAEDQPLEFLSPYGCSKGGADQYVLDYARSYGIHATVFRMSCIYGPYQRGSEDQGWVAHFLRQAMKDETVTIYGDGKQVRDLLFVEDLVRAMRLAQDNLSVSSGEAFNLGGGPRNSTSLLELLSQIKLLSGRPVKVDWGAERLADQRWYVANTGKLERLLGWRPATSIRRGLAELASWYQERPDLVGQATAQVA